MRDRDGGDSRTEEDEDAPPPEVKIIVEKIRPLDEVSAASTDPIRIDLDAEARDAEERLAALRLLMEKHPGKTPVHLHLDLGKFWCRMGLPEACKIKPGPLWERDLGMWLRGERI